MIVLVDSVMNLNIRGTTGHPPLLEAGHKVEILDNLSNLHAEVLDRIKQTSRRTISLFKIDIRDRRVVQTAFESI